MIDALNSLYGIGKFDPPAVPSPAALQARDHVRDMVRFRKPPAARQAPQEALRELLRSSAVYGDGSNTAPFRHSSVALPDSIGDGCPVTELVRAEDRDYLDGFDQKVLLDDVVLHQCWPRKELRRFM